MKSLIKTFLLLGCLNSISLNAQELIPETDLPIGRAQEFTRNINHPRAKGYARLKKGVCLLYWYSDEIKGFASGTGFLVNTVNNSYDDETQKIYLVTVNHNDFPLGENIPEEKKREIFITFDYESANPYFKKESDFEADENTRIKRLWRLQVNLLVRDPEPDLALYEIVSDDSNHPWTIKNSPVYKYAHALGWTLHPKITTSSDIAQIGHPRVDLKKFLKAPDSFKFEQFGINFDHNFVEMKIFPNQGYFQEPGSSGSPVFDKKGQVFSVANRSRKDPPLYQYATLLENLWYRKDSKDMMKYLDPQKTWVSSVPGGFLEGMVPQNTDLTLEVGVEPKVSSPMDFKAIDFFGFERIGRKREKELGDGIILSGTNNDEVFLTLYPARENDRLLYGCFLSDFDATVSTKVFSGMRWNTASGKGPISPSHKSSISGFPNDSKLLKSWLLKYLKDNNSIGINLRDFQFKGQLQIQSSSGTSKVTAIKLPDQMPYNAVELFEPERLQDLWKSYDYHPSRGKNSKELNIKKISYVQGDGVPKNISTGNNGGYLNLININYKVGPITTSYGAVNNKFKITIDLHNPSEESVSYAVWIDYFNGDVFGGKQTIDHSYNFVYDPALHEVELFKSGTTTGALIQLNEVMPSGEEVELAPGDSRMTRMRIAVKKGTVPPTQGEIFAHGEVEDYLIEIQAPDCGDLIPTDYAKYAENVLPYCDKGGYRESKESLADHYEESTPGELTFNTGVASDIPYATATGFKCSFNGRNKENLLESCFATVVHETQSGEYFLEDGQLKMDVYYPVSKSEVDMADLQALPLIIYAHGGGYVLNRDDQIGERMCRWLASKGYVVAAIDYRLGLNITEGELSKRAIVRAWQDLQAAVMYWRHQSEFDDGEHKWKIDPNKVYGVGFSAGAIAVLHNLYLDQDTYESERSASVFPEDEPGYLLSASSDYTFTLTNWSEIVQALKDVWNHDPDAINHINHVITQHKTYRTYDLDAYPTYPCIGPNGPCTPGSLTAGQQTEMEQFMELTDGRLNKGGAFSGALARVEWMFNEQSRPVRFAHHQQDAVVSYLEDEPFSYLGDVANIYNFATTGSVFTPKLNGGGRMFEHALDEGFANFGGEPLIGSDMAGGGIPYHRSMQQFGSTDNNEPEQKLMYYLDALFTKDWTSTVAGRAVNSQLEQELVKTNMEMDVEPTFNVFPNPASDQLNILAEIRQAGPLHVQIYDLQGRKVFDLSRDHIGEGHQLITLRNLDLVSGSYVLKVQVGNMVQRRKVLVE